MTTTGFIKRLDEDVWRKAKTMRARGMSIPRIARTLGVSESTLNSRFYPSGQDHRPYRLGALIPMEEMEAIYAGRRYG